MSSSPSEALAQLVPPELLEMLRARPLVLRRPVWGQTHGRHRSARAGLGLDFRDHRPYTPGDDLRRLDWRAVARRDRLILRRTEGEDALPVVVLVDGGGNMRYGGEQQNRARVAGALAASVAWVATGQGDAIGIGTGAAGTSYASQLRPASGRDRLVALGKVLTETKNEGRCPWPALLTEATLRALPRSLFVIFSDFLDPGGRGDPGDDEQFVRGLSHIRARGHDVVLVQILHRDELVFPWEDRRMIRFVDLYRRREPVEGAGAAMRDAYLEQLGKYLEWMEAQCQAHGLVLLQVTTDEPLTRSALRLLARLGGGSATIREEASQEADR